MVPGHFENSKIFWDGILTILIFDGFFYSEILGPVLTMMVPRHFENSKIVLMVFYFGF